MAKHSYHTSFSPRNTVKHSGLKLFYLISAVLLSAMLAVSCNKNKKDQVEVSSDPLPGELVQDALRADSIRTATMGMVKDSMKSILVRYEEKLPNKEHMRYFMTDLDHDKMPELWIRNGSARDDQRLELYAPLKSGGLKKSEIQARHSDYYLGDDYVVQVMRGDPGKILLNELTINNGNLESHLMKELDLSKDPTLSNPKIDLPEVKTSPIGNLTLLDQAFEGDIQASSKSRVDIGISGMSLNKFFTGRNFLAHKH